MLGGRRGCTMKRKVKTEKSRFNNHFCKSLHDKIVLNHKSLHKKVERIVSANRRREAERVHRYHAETEQNHIKGKDINY